MPLACSYYIPLTSSLKSREHGIGASAEIAACVTLEEINLAANKPGTWAKWASQVRLAAIAAPRLNEDALAPLAALPALRVLNISRTVARSGVL